MARPMYSSVMGLMVSSSRILSTSAGADVAEKSTSRRTHARTQQRQGPRTRAKALARDERVFKPKKVITYAAAALSPPAWLLPCASSPGPTSFPAPVAARDRRSALPHPAYCLSNRAAPEPAKIPPRVAAGLQSPPRCARRRDRWTRRLWPTQDARRHYSGPDLWPREIRAQHPR